MQNNPRAYKIKSLLICALVYMLALGIAYFSGFVLRGNYPVLIAGCADLSATAVVFIFSMVFNNSSLYDPYWSLAPLPIAIYWIFQSPLNPLSIRQVLVLVLLLVWAFRLTYNWGRGWQGLKHEDWRYAERRSGSGRFYWAVSFFGFHLFPTIIVFTGCLPLYPVLTAGGKSFGILDIIALLVTVSEIDIETLADRQLATFISRRKNDTENISSGLWSFSRHPNYFGEVLFWWGLYIFGLAADPAWWWAIIGPVLITSLFLFISIPMMEKHILKKKAAYLVYTKTVLVFLPWFRSRRSNRRQSA
jgi:steroid 5-alpha reductase family enzyme